MKVAQVARRVAEHLLRQNVDDDALLLSVGLISPDVVEAAALAHDLGHPPFGHMGEQTLDKALRDTGNPEGFEGNPQSFRIVTKLALRHESDVGLDLTKATLNGLLKYPWMREPGHAYRNRKWGAYSSESDDFEWARSLRPIPDRARSAEAALMDWADDISYAVHDLEDFYRVGLIPLDRLLTSDRETSRYLSAIPERWRSIGADAKFSEAELTTAFEELRKWIVRTFDSLSEPFTGHQRQRAQLRTCTSSLIGRYVRDGARLREPAAAGEESVTLNPALEVEVVTLKELTWHYVINNPALATQQAGQRRLIRELFMEFSEASENDRSVFPPRYSEQLTQVDRLDGAAEVRAAQRLRVVADLIAGLSEDRAVEIHARLTGRSFGSVLDISSW